MLARIFARKVAGPTETEIRETRYVKACEKTATAWNNGEIKF